MSFYTPYQKKADRAYQKLAEGKTCLVCGKPADCMHHVIYKSQSNALRYDIKNLVPLCLKCHFKHHSPGRNNSDPNILATIIKRKGQAWFDDLQARRNIYTKADKKFYLEAVKRLNNEK